MEPVLAILLAFLVAGIISIGILIVVWLFLVSFYLPYTDDGSNTMFIGYAIANMGSIAGEGPFVIFNAFLTSSLEIISFVRENLFTLFVLGLACTGAFLWFEYHDSAIKAYLVFRQCGTRPLIDNFILPLLNIVRIAANAIIPLVNFGASLIGFGEYGAPVILFECTASSFSVAQFAGYVGIFLREAFHDFTAWVSGNPFEHDWDISNGLAAFAHIFTAFIPAADCFCRGLHFVWVYIATLLGMPSLHAALNFTWMSIVNFFQIPLQALVRGNHKPDFTTITMHSCAAVESAGTFVEETVYLTLENLYGLITNRTDLPEGISAALSIPYTSILTHPICGLFKVVNMTFNATLNIDQVFVCNGSGVKYFQFGHVFDEIEVAILAVGSFGNLLNDDTQALVNSILLAIKDFFAFLFEWVIGNIFYESCGGSLPASFDLYGAPTNGTVALRFWRYYFVDYWFKAAPLNTTFTLSVPPGVETRESPVKLGNYTYSSALFDFFDDLVRADQSLGNLIGLVNRPLGQAVKHFLNVVVGLVKFLGHFLSYSYCVLTFQCDGMPITARDVDLEFLFNESLFFAGAAGDLVRQFDNASCTNTTPGEYNKTALCMTGNVITTTIDVIVLFVREIFHFLQDLLTLPTGQVRSCLFETRNVSRRECMRIVDLTTAITELDDALCDLSYAVTGLIPVNARLNCTFAPVVNISDPRQALEPPKSCSRVQTCLGYEFCSITRFIPILLQIVNTFFIKIYSGTFFASISEFLEYAIAQLVNQFATVGEQFALILDCVVCALKGVPTEGCTSPIYDFIKPIGNAVRELSRIFTGIFLRFVRVLLLFIVGFFSGNPVTALIDFVASMLKDVFLGFLSGIIDFVAQLLDRIGLGFLGSFIKILYQGLCFTLETIINIVISIIRFFGSSQKKVSFCCGGGQCDPSSNTRKRGELNELLFDDDNKTVRVDIDNWLRLIEGQFVWQESDACNLSIYAYKDIGWTSLGDYEKGETMFCFAKLMWRHRDDGQSSLGNSTCDALVMENVDRNFKELSLLEKREMMTCIENRFFTEAIRKTLNISWLPQDLFTEPWRKYYFGLELARGYLINYHFYNDRITLPSVMLMPEYQASWAHMGLDTRHYEALRTVDDVIAFKASSHLKTYFDANNATQYDATLYTVTGLWSIADRFITAIGNISLSFDDKETDASVYLSYNYSLDNPMEASARGFLAVISDLVGAFSTLTRFWKDPENYKKRDEASESVNFIASEAYREVWHQFALMMREWRNESALYNHSCTTREECDAIEALREKYETPSWASQASQWWSRLDTTTYPIKNPRYRDHLVQPDDRPLTYVDEHGITKSETRYERVTRYITMVRHGTRAARHRWSVLTTFVERTRDKVYTRILRKFLSNDEYMATTHHRAMQTRYEQENPWAINASRTTRPKPTTICLGYDGESQCVREYRLHSTAYEDSESSGIVNRIDTAAMRRLNPLTQPGNTVFGAAVHNLSESSLLQIPCVNPISFPCRFPLKCSSNVTTMCDQCLYLHALIDRAIAATEQLIANFRQGGRFNQSLNKALHFFNYTFDANARVIVGDSPELHVALFPRRGDGLWDTIVESVRYMGDDTPNKLRLNDFIALFNMTFTGVEVSDATLFTRPMASGIHSAVFSVVSTIFYDVFNFLYRVYLTLVGGAFSDDGFGLAAHIGRTLLVCDWLQGHDLDGTLKRFSIGEVVLILGSIVLFADAVFGVLFGFSLFSMVMGTMTGATIGLSIFLMLHANWAYLCAPGLNVALPDDVFYFFAYNLFAKCSWFWGFMIDSLYTNSNCYSCEEMQRAVLTHCVHKVGFHDFLYNLAFTARFFFPSAITYLSSSNSVLGQLAFVRTRIAQYESLDLSDPFLWSRYMGCNFFVTMPATLTIFLLFTLFATATLYPVINGFLSILSWFWSLWLQLLVVLYFIVLDILTNPGFDPVSSSSPLVDQDQDDDDDTTTTTTNVSSRRVFYPRPSAMERRIEALGVRRLRNVWRFFSDRYQDLHEHED